MTDGIKLISWNMAGSDKAWRLLVESDADIALVQEARKPPPEVAERVTVNPGRWRTGGGLNRHWRTAIAVLSDRVAVTMLETTPLESARHGDLPVSQQGTLAVAQVMPASGEAFVIASVYAPWEKQHGSTGTPRIYADASAHRLISDLSALIGRHGAPPALVAGDLNILYGYGERGSAYWRERYATVFQRMSALGLHFVGPQAPAGWQAQPWPEELPTTSKNVPTYYTNRQTPATARRQLDFVFASAPLVDRVSVTALNDPETWGPSDHCRIEIRLR